MISLCQFQRCWNVAFAFWLSTKICVDWEISSPNNQLGPSAGLVCPVRLSLVLLVQLQTPARRDKYYERGCWTGWTHDQLLIKMHKQPWNRTDQGNGLTNLNKYLRSWWLILITFLVRSGWDSKTCPVPGDRGYWRHRDTEIFLHGCSSEESLE